MLEEGQVVRRLAARLDAAPVRDDVAELRRQGAAVAPPFAFAGMDAGR